MSRWTPIWGDDLARFFTHSPQEFALFYYLLLNARYEEEPWGLWIKGRNYCKWHMIYKGDVLTSKIKIQETFGFHTYTTKKLLKNIVGKGMIELILEDPALIVRIKNYFYFSYSGKPTERPTYNHTPPCSDVNIPPSELNTPPCSDVNTPPSELNTPPSLLSSICKKEGGNSNKFIQVDEKKGGDPVKSEDIYNKNKNYNQIYNEREAADAADNSLSNSLNNISLEGEVQNQDKPEDGFIECFDLLDPHENEKSIPLIDFNTIAEDWLRIFFEDRSKTQETINEIVKTLKAAADRYKITNMQDLKGLLNCVNEDGTQWLVNQFKKPASTLKEGSNGIPFKEAYDMYKRRKLRTIKKAFKRY